MIPIAKPVIGKDEIDAVVRVLKSGNLAQGPVAREFEERFSSYIGTKYAVSCSSGTSALQVGLEAAGVKAGDEVVTTAFTFIASANSILYNRGKVVFADINERTFNIDPVKVMSAITGKTKAVLIVDLYGQPCEMDTIREVCDEKGILLIEDSAQAHGAEYKGKKAGTFGDLSVFSFYPTKNMTTGEGGMMLTESESIFEKAKVITDQGQVGRYEHVMVGYNYRLTDIQAAMGIVQLRKLDRMNEKRTKNAGFLTKKLKGIEWLETPYVAKGAKHAWHQYTIKVSSGMRDRFVKYLDSNGIGSKIYYPMPVYMQPAYQEMGYKRGLCPVAESVSKQVVSIPVHPSLKKSDLNKIVETIGGYR